MKSIYEGIIEFRGKGLYFLSLKKAFTHKKGWPQSFKIRKCSNSNRVYYTFLHALQVALWQHLVVKILKSKLVRNLSKRTQQNGSKWFEPSLTPLGDENIKPLLREW